MSQMQKKERLFGRSFLQYEIKSTLLCKVLFLKFTSHNKLVSQNTIFWKIAGKRKTAFMKIGLYYYSKFDDICQAQAKHKM